MNKESFAYTYERILTKNGLSEHLDKIEQMFYLSDRLVETNKSLNLTAITDEDGVILKHLADSLSISAYIEEGASVLDVGCGAGFPSLPLAIARPDIRLVSVDSTEKKIQYVNETARLLGLDHLKAIAMRAEDGARDPALRETFDVCTARAVAYLPLLCELCLPYVRVGGLFLAMKAKGGEAELEAARNAIHTLCGSSKDTTVRTACFSLESDTESYERNLIVIRKGGHTPKNFPRHYSQMKKKPL